MIISLLGKQLDKVGPAGSSAMLDLMQAPSVLIVLQPHCCIADKECVAQMHFHAVLLGQVPMLLCFVPGWWVAVKGKPRRGQAGPGLISCFHHTCVAWCPEEVLCCVHVVLQLPADPSVLFSSMKGLGLQSSFEHAIATRKPANIMKLERPKKKARKMNIRHMTNVHMAGMLTGADAQQYTSIDRR